MLDNIKIKDDILHDDKYLHLYSVEEVNKKVIEGLPFRDAYKTVGKEIEEGTFNPSKHLKHTHEGSIGNLKNTGIKEKMENLIGQFHFDKVEEALRSLLN